MYIATCGNKKKLENKAKETWKTKVCLKLVCSQLFG